MIHYTELTDSHLLEAGSEIVKHTKRKERVDYLNVESAFDIETTSEYVQGEKVSHMYIWMFGIKKENPVCYGRTWEEFLELTARLQDFYTLGEGRRLVVYVHNLSYEFQFFKHLFNWAEVFAMSKGTVLKAYADCGIEFRCSLRLSGSSLANVARNLTGEYACKKMEGDLDYSLIRHAETELTEAELGYCENDILVVLNYIAKEIKLAKGIHLIEMTNTGRVRTRIRNAFLYNGQTSSKKAGSTYQRARELMDSLTMDLPTYLQCKSTFQGGFTHSNPKRTAAVINDVSSYDLTSSYPTVMCAERFPMGSPQAAKLESIDQVRELSKSHCVMFRAKFTGIKNKIGFESYFSEHKCAVSGDRLIANGRIYEGEEVITYITDIDLFIADNVYSWDSLELTQAKAFRKGYLPRAIINEILVMYSDKTTLKGVEGREDDYMLSKGMLNSTYGMCVTDPVKDEHTFTDEWICEPADRAEKIDQYNSNKKRALYYPWGIWVTAYARRNLWLAILNIGEDYIYADTDSVKFTNADKHVNFFEAYNRNITHKLEEMCDYLSIDKTMLCPETIKGEKAPLGVWDYEGKYENFKTLGAKRYLTEKNGKLQLTVAGLSKQNGLNYMKELAQGDNEKVFSFFNDGLFIPADKTGKMTHTNVEGKKRFICTDYTGKRYNVTTLSGMHLEPASFDMSLSSDFLWFLENQAAGLSFAGGAISI